MSKPMYSRDLPAYLIKRQGSLSITKFASSIGLSRQYLVLIQDGTHIPSPRCLRGMGLEVVLRVEQTGRMIRLSDLGAYLTKLQGKKPEVERAAEVGLTRQHYHQIRAGLTAMPAAWALEKLGLAIMYQETARASKRT